MVTNNQEIIWPGSNPTNIFGDFLMGFACFYLENIIFVDFSSAKKLHMDLQTHSNHLQSVLKWSYMYVDLQKIKTLGIGNS